MRSVEKSIGILRHTGQCGVFGSYPPLFRFLLQLILYTIFFGTLLHGIGVLSRGGVGLTLSRVFLLGLLSFPFFPLLFFLVFSGRNKSWILWFAS